MTTTINNTERVFQIRYGGFNQVFCNIRDLNKIILELNLKAGYYKIYHFIDCQPKLLSQNLLSKMLAALEIKQEFYYQSHF